MMLWVRVRAIQNTTRKYNTIDESSSKKKYKKPYINDKNNNTARCQYTTQQKKHQYTALLRVVDTLASFTASSYGRDKLY